LTVLVSGGGSNLEAILAAQESGQLNGGKVVLVISSKSGVGALDRARNHKIDAVVLEPGALLAKLIEVRTDVVCLAGYLRKLNPDIIQRYRGRILNIHPALLPKFGGPGMYGRFVHEAVLKAGERESGCSVHIVDEEFDHGPVLAQVRVPVLPGDNAEKLAARILEQEHKLYPKMIREFCEKLLVSGMEL
jgi:phosphoribosylglycinamide formyltransferase-1